MAAKEAPSGHRHSVHPAHSGGAARSAQGYSEYKARQVDVLIQNVQELVIIHLF